MKISAGGLLLWLIGMVVGSVVFATPSLHETPAIPYLTANPFITVPIVALWSVVSWVLARRGVPTAPDPQRAGLRIGLGFLAINAALDLGLVVIAMDAGARFYSYAGLWLAYGVLVTVPWLAGRAAAAEAAYRSGSRPASNTIAARGTIPSAS